MQKEYLTKSPGETKKLGEALAKTLLRNPPKNRATVVGLRGDLGGGKTTFLQGFAKGIEKRVKILSPTFIIIRRTGNFYHIDCYRIQGPKDLLVLGFKKILADPKNIVAIEWADLVKKIMPRYAIWVDFKFISENERKITINNF